MKTKAEIKTRIKELDDEFKKTVKDRKKTVKQFAKLTQEGCLDRTKLGEKTNEMNRLMEKLIRLTERKSELAWALMEDYDPFERV
jgi:HSP90 family molecular chaperone